MTSVGINGFGRIGRNFWRAVHAMDNPGIEIGGGNDLGDIHTFAHLLKYDTVLGLLNVDVSVPMAASWPGIPRSSGWRSVTRGTRLGRPGRRRGRRIHWHLHQLRRCAQAHRGWREEVIISAPAKGGDITIVLGVNDDK